MLFTTDKSVSNAEYQSNTIKKSRLPDLIPAGTHCCDPVPYVQVCPCCLIPVASSYRRMNRFRRIQRRREKKRENYAALLYFACGIIVWNKTLLARALSRKIISGFIR